MSTPGEITTPDSSTPTAKSPMPGTRASERTLSRIQTDYLLERSVICDITTSGIKHPRYVRLETQQLFNRLSMLYALHFQSKWNELGHILAGTPMPTGTQGWDYLAKVYISHWILDLYVSIREAVLKHPLADHSGHYIRESYRNSASYDYFLVLLLNHLKPTRLIGLTEDALYVPILSNTSHWLTLPDNPYNITGFTLNRAIFGALLRIMTGSNSKWNMSAPSTDALGRPFWLFDWHDDQAFAWFPSEENYNLEDVNLAFIIGVSCTPLMASRDEDVPRQYPYNLPVPVETLVTPSRIRDKRFHSMFDVRVIEDVTYHKCWETLQERPAEPLPRPRAPLRGLPDPGATITPEEEEVLRKEAEDYSRAEMEYQQSLVPPAPAVMEHTISIYCYQIIDYKYYARVIRKTDINCRAAAHKILIYKD